MNISETLSKYKKLRGIEEAMSPDIPPEIEAKLKAEMKGWIEDVFDIYNDLLDKVARVNVRDEDFRKEWAKVDKAFNGMIKIYNKKYK